MYGVEQLPVYWLAAVASAIVHNCNLWEWGITLVLLEMAWAGWPPVPERLLAAMARLARTRIWAYAALAAMTVGVRLVLLPWKPPPLPYVPDEWSHRFLADTLLLGRLANPAHPLAEFFETIHILAKPVYASMYLPGPALFLAAGKAVLGSHYAGVLLACGLMAAALLWMLRGWLSLELALWGAFLGTAKALWNGSASGYWMDSYWGGAPAALAGALVLGAAGRIGARRGSPVVMGGVLGSGVALLAVTRPFEGLLLTVAVGVYLLWRRLDWRVMAGAALVLLPAGWMVSNYCQAVTGKRFELPYALNQRLYGWPMTTLWMKPEMKAIEHQKLIDYWNWERGEHKQIETAEAVAVFVPIKVMRQWHHYAGPLLAIPLLLLGAAWRMRQVRPLLVIGLVGLAAVVTEQSAFPHYFAPFTGCVLAAAAVCSKLWWDRSPRLGRIYLAWLPVAFLAALAARTQAGPVTRAPEMIAQPGWCCQYRLGEARENARLKLERMGGRHVVLVRYTKPDQNFTFDWVYNPPEIDQAAVIFARDRGEPVNGQLRAYYPDRKFWLAIPDADPVVMRPYDQVSLPHEDHPSLVSRSGAGRGAGDASRTGR